MARRGSMKLVFVSSTFRDMQHERDAINSMVAPRLDAFLEKYAESVHFGDLRWGVNTTELEGEESSKKVLSVCLDQIDDSRPYMIVLIGERYGWIPAYELLHQAALLKGIDESVIDESTSVTNLEIEYGALLNPDYEGRVLFYFRNPLDTSKMTETQRADYECESPVHRQKMDELKAKILEKYPSFVRYYDAEYNEEKGIVEGLAPLCDMIYEDLVKIFDLDLTYISSLPSEERAILSSKKHFEGLAQNSYKRKIAYLNDFDIDEIEYFYQARYEHNPVLEILDGENGMGAKTTVAQEYYSCLDNEENALCFSFGLDEFTSDLASFKRTLAYTLEEHLGIEHRGDISTDAICALLNAYENCAEQPFLRVFLINAPASIITFLHEIAVKLPNLYGIGFHVHLKFGLKADTPLPFFPKSIVTTVPELEKKEAREVINAVLKSKRKELPKIVIDEMVKHKGSTSPLYLSLLTQRLIMLDYEDFASIRAMGDGMDNINKYMISIIKNAGKSIRDISRELLSELSQRINPEMAKHLIAHMTLNHHLNEKGIMELFEYKKWSYSALDYAIFKRTFPALMYENSKGMLFFANDDIKSGALDLVKDLGCENDIDSVIEFLKTKSHTYRKKALGRMLYERGDASALLDEYLPYIDISPDLARDKEKSKSVIEEFSTCTQYLQEILSDSFDKENGFALEVIKEICNRIYSEKIANPYTVSTYLFEFINPDFSDMSEVNRSLDTLISIVEIVEGANINYQSEPLLVLEYLLYTIYAPTFLGMATTKRQSEFFGAKRDEYAKRKGGIDAIAYNVIKQGKMSIARASSRSITGAFQMYKVVKSSENPTQCHAFEMICKICSDIEKQQMSRVESYYDSLLDGKYIPDDFAEIIVLGMNAYRYLLLENLEMARVCYYAFYSCFENKVKKEGADSYFIGQYFELLYDMCSYFVQAEKREVALGLFTMVLEFVEETLAKHYTSINACSSLIALILLGKENDMLTNSADHLYLPFEICQKRLKYASDSYAFDDAFDLFFEFLFVFDDEEAQYYLNELIYSTCEAFAGNGISDLKIIDFIIKKIYTYTQDKESTIDALADLLEYLADEYYDTFDKEIEEYLDYAGDVLDRID